MNPDGSIIPDELIIAALESYRKRKEFANGGGYQKLSHYLRRDHDYTVNPKKVYRLCQEHNLLLPRRKKRQKRRSKRCVNRIITAPFQMWQLDLKYGFIHGENRFFFILAIIDVYMRLIVNYHIGLSCKGKDLVFTLDQGLKDFDIPDENQLIIRSDNGSQMTSTVFTEYFQDFGEDQVLHELIPPATPNKNAHIEAFNSILEIEFVQPRYFMTYGQAYRETVDFIGFYNSFRLHGSLKNRTPMEVYESYQRGEALNIQEIRI